MSFRNEFERPKIVLRHFKVIFLAVLPTSDDCSVAGGVAVWFDKIIAIIVTPLQGCMA